MKKTLKIEGMMCGHCEMHVRKALEELPQVDSAVVSHTDGTAVITMNSDVPDETFAAAIAAQGYTMV